MDLVDGEDGSRLHGTSEVEGRPIVVGSDDTGSEEAMRPAPPRRFALALLTAVACLTCAREPAPAPEVAAADAPGAKLFAGLGDHTHPISTDSTEAQRWFDQGLMLTFGFNHDAAIRAFEEAARHDPRCAMCWWGVAFVLGPNYNAPMGPDATGRALAALARARALAPGASDAERAYVEALGARYSSDLAADRVALDRGFADAMGAVARAYPEDLDAATFHAEALMNLRPWKLYSNAGEPAPDTPEIVGILESVLARDPAHPGANHLYIHAVEASRTPERALAAADRLGGLAPDAGHLVHMPSHIYWRVGFYDRAAEVNRLAVLSDEAFFALCGSQGAYGALYYPHNIHFLWAAASESGSGDLALMTARQLAAKVPPEMLRDFPFVEQFRPIPVQTLVRFGRFDEVLGEPRPPDAERYSLGVWHYARGLALLRRGDRALAEAELAALEAIAASEEMAKLDLTNEPASRYLALAVAQLGGELAAARGDVAGAVAKLEAGIRMQDSMVYTEPPRWHMSLRQTLGAILLEHGRAAEAEAVYRADLVRVPGSGWSLYGLAQSLAAQGKDAEAELARRGHEIAWARADVALRSSRF
jgi:tetratricopeptide (TPR) repeat protein